MTGAMFASRDKKHIRIDLLSHYLPDKYKNYINRITDFFTAFICGLVAFYSIEFIQYEYEEGLIAFANVPVWLCETVIPFAFSVMALRYFIFSILPSHLNVTKDDGVEPPSELV